MSRTTVFGFYLQPFTDLADLTRRVVDQPGVYVSLGAEGLMRMEPEFREAVNRSVCYSDGIGAVLAARLICGVRLVKIPGCELWLSVLNAMPPARIAIWGASERILTQVLSKIAADFPHHKVVYAANGYSTNFNEARDTMVREEPDIVVLALGQPRQELLADWLIQDLPRARILPIGGALDVYVGKVRRAPNVLIRLHLEWAYRLWLEPSRFRRQLILPKFMLRVFIEKMIMFFN